MCTVYCVMLCDGNRKECEREKKCTKQSIQNFSVFAHLNAGEFLFDDCNSPGQVCKIIMHIIIMGNKMCCYLKSHFFFCKRFILFTHKSVPLRKLFFSHFLLCLYIYGSLFLLCQLLRAIHWICLINCISKRFSLQFFQFRK